MRSQLDSQVTEHNVHPIYRPDIDGLRALAILSVVIFHAFPSILPGGFVGVDIFFVISGFLISTIVFRSLQRGDFSFTEFYSHRIKRIFPALIVVLTASYAFGWFSLLPDEFKQLGKHMAAGAGFAQNFILWREVGYFDTTAELKPLLNLWSLAIEEQFYLVYPLFVFAVWRTGLNLLVPLVLLGIISFALNVSEIAKLPADTFYLPHTRFWELLSGGVLAYLQFCKTANAPRGARGVILGHFIFRFPPLSPHQKERFNNPLSLAGLLLLVASVFLIDKHKPFPGWWALLPVSGAFFLILSGPCAWVNRLMLANKLMVFVGLISYPLYLWHWPILSFARIVAANSPSWQILVGMLLLSFLLAWLTYLFIERPIRFGRRIWLKTAALPVTLAIIGYLGFNAFQRDGLEFRYREILKITKAAGEWGYPGKLIAVNNEAAFDYYFLPSGRKSLTLFVGDSNIEQYFPRAEALIASDPDHTNGVIFKTLGGCLPIPEQPHNAIHSHCSMLMKNALRIARDKTEIDAVVIGSLWFQYLMYGIAMEKTYGVGSAEYVYALDKLGRYIKELRALDKRVFLLLNIPVGNPLDPKAMVKRDLQSFPRVLSIQPSGIPRSELEKYYGQMQADLAKVAADSGATVINPMDFLCARDCSAVDDEGEPIYKDAGHLRPSYVRRNANFIDATMR